MVSFISYKTEDRAAAILAERLAVKYGVHPAVARKIRIAALLHDVGKSKIPEGILNKPGKLNEQESEIMRTHTLLGAEMLSSVRGSLGEMAREICLYHHEWYDGVGGYWGRYTCELPVYVPIVAISDVFIALVSHRPYKQAWTKKDALDYIESQAGTQFSPALVEMFLSFIRNDSCVETVVDLRSKR